MIGLKQNRIHCNAMPNMIMAKRVCRYVRTTVQKIHLHVAILLTVYCDGDDLAPAGSPTCSLSICRCTSIHIAGAKIHVAMCMQGMRG